MPLPAIDVPQPPWTYDLEIALFRAIVSYRPVGFHKPFRLLSILNSINSQLNPSDTPITLADIKSKLDQLYDIQGIEDQAESETTSTEEYTEFKLPFEDVVGIIEDRGKAIDGDCSPLVLLKLLQVFDLAEVEAAEGRSGGEKKAALQLVLQMLEVMMKVWLFYVRKVMDRIDLSDDGDETETASEYRYAKKSICLCYACCEHGVKKTREAS